MLNPSPASTREVTIDHERIRFVDPSLFTLSFVNDCRTHSCRCRDENDRPRADACCQHGADLYLPEKLAILRRTAEIQSVLNPDRRAPERWFDEREPGHEDGIDIIRVATSDMDDESSGCVFLGHGSGRGCGLHVAALKHGFDPAEIKPSVCRLYPLSLDGKRLGLSDDFDRYSCANAGETSIYRAMRDTLGQLFGGDLVRLLDQIERSIEARGNGSRESASHESASRRLRVVG
jgi:Fe-S-cluster containining protein